MLERRVGGYKLTVEYGEVLQESRMGGHVGSCDSSPDGDQLVISTMRCG